MPAAQPQPSAVSVGSQSQDPGAAADIEPLAGAAGWDGCAVRLHAHRQPGWIRIAFKNDNRARLYHRHVAWHMSGGLMMEPFQMEIGESRNLI